ncbi:3-deoxy-D-manno-octulosonic acid transferase [Variovorax sp. J22G21]|uniref:3-deoxy-D-manno-octulosonic acid transferase n=1 Tax=Variovorax fucosicus TaxID=3053517 RepID=UPI002577D4D2|nr:MULTISPECIES: 3-deoxy-D-manno-octulosonic acid transferase [unclassified Variovorax]MDM0040780.1 3-deoxy-D-manno-octulosonic acid transferase [Variovorax sp. J22R193]MDM0059509.1 3-deoxy-D-manno-octulosonic acid transferase [Variovorax sp. J22G47]MDM0062153.1 3-deoxy-D-manno-octulosonic acid transferase [Variovorax sp. J22G21]
MRSLSLRLYGVVTWLMQPLVRRKLRRRAVAEPGYAMAVEERFGHYPTTPAGTDWCWIHAVSLGEARAAAILIEELRRQAPGIRLLLTHGTATGREEGAKLLQTGDIQVWQPWDTPSAVARFLDRFAPRIGVLMETEVWPEMTAACAERGIPLVLANARLNEKSLASAERLGWLARPAYSALAAVWAQTEADSHRLVSLGAKVAGVFGNMKFDAAPETRQLVAAANLRARLPKPVVVFASSRDGEEQQFLEVLKRFGATVPVPPVQVAVNSIAKRVHDVQWMIVPRHPQRFDEVAALVEAQGFAVARRSTAGEEPGDAEIWLGDSLGEMALYYGLAHVALLGGSFEPLGGQNLIEAAACGCPVVMGPSTFNFAEAAELSLAAGAAQRVPDMEHAVKVALALVADPARHDAMVQAALAFSSSNRGAAQRTAAALLAIAVPAGPAQ